MRSTLAICALSLMMLGGCATYQAEKADLSCGGQSCRLQAAQERRATAEAEQLGLKEDQASARQELAALQAELRNVNSNRTTQESRLENARSTAKISDEEAARVRRKLNAQTEAFNDKALELEAARSGGSGAEIAQKKRELQRLRDELEATNREIEILSE